MPNKTINQIRKNKAFKTIAVCAMVFLFVASLLMAIVLPFADTVGVAEASSAPVYPETVKSGAYVDFSGFNAVPFTDITSEDFQFYGFYYDVSVALPAISNYNSSIYMYNAEGANVPFTASSSRGTLHLFSSSIGVNANFMFSTNGSGTKFIYLIETDAPNMVYSLNGLYFGSPMHFKRLNGYALFANNPEYFSHWYAITSNVPDAIAEVIKLKQDNAILQQEKDLLQSQYNDLLNGLDFSVFNSVNLDSAPVYPSSGFKASATSISIDSKSYSGYWYRRSSVEAPVSRGCLTELNIGSTMLANSDIKCTFDAFYKYNGEVSQDIYVGLLFTEYGIKSLSDDTGAQVYQKFIPYNEWLNGSFIISCPFNVNYIAFDLFDSEYNQLPLSYNLNTGVSEGLFISNFVVSGRGSNFKTAIDNANKQGFNTGFEQGFTQGKDIGYAQGSKDQGDYTFLGLIGAVFDAPISAFQGLLNFEVLGVNMSAFVLSLFSLAVIVVIVKIALGGK